jgi:hypothetical protein
MVVVAIIGILAGLGLVYVNAGQKGKFAQGYSETLEAQYEMARARAVATQRRQRIEITATGFSHWQYVNEGLAEDKVLKPFGDPDSWEFVFEADAPRDITIEVVHSDLHFDADDVHATNVMLFPARIDVLPDGRARSEGSIEFFEPGWTVFISDDKKQVRTLLFAVTGTASTVSEW